MPINSQATPYTLLRRPTSFKDGHYLFTNKDNQLFLADHSIDERTLNPASTDDGLLTILLEAPIEENISAEYGKQYHIRVYVANEGRNSRAFVNESTYAAIQAHKKAVLGQVTQ
jgi:hypothetical protein